MRAGGGHKKSRRAPVPDTIPGGRRAKNTSGTGAGSVGEAREHVGAAKEQRRTMRGNKKALRAQAPEALNSKSDGQNLFRHACLNKKARPASTSASSLA